MIQWKKIILSTIAAIGIACFAGGTADAASVKIDEKTFPNACVRTFANKQDTNHDGELSDAEIKAVTKLDWNGQNLYTYGVASGMEIDFTGMEVFTNLKQVTMEQLFQGGKYNCKYWNCKNTDIFSVFPYVEKLNLFATGQVTLSTANRNLKHLEIAASNVSVNAPITSVEQLTVCSTLNGHTKLGGYSQDWGKCFPNARVVQMNYVKDLEKEIYGFKRVEQISIAYYGGNKIFDLSIYKDTLKRLDVANSWQDLQQNSNPLEEMTTLKTIDISHMRKLETLEACNVGSLERLVVKDSKGKCELNKLKTIHLVNNKIKSLNLSVVPNLEEVYVGGKLTNLNINQCKRLKKLLIDSNSLKKLIIKNRSLKYLDVSSKVIQKINVTGCPNLIGVTIDRKSKASMGNLDLSKNKKLVYFHANRNARFKKIILPKLSNSKQLNTSYKQYDRAEKCRYTGYGITVDVSKYRKMPVKVKKYQVKTVCNSTTKRLVINKKLRKADKKWIKKFAKKWHVKVVEKL